MSIADQPFGDIAIIDHASSDLPSISIDRHRCASNRALPHELTKFVSGFGTTTIVQAITSTTELSGLRRIDAKDADALAMNLDGVAVNYGRPPNKVGYGRLRDGENYDGQEPKGASSLFESLRLPKKSHSSAPYRRLQSDEM